MAIRGTQQQRQQVEAIISAMEGQMETAFRKAFEAVANTIDMAALIDALNAGNIDLAVQMLRVDQSLLYPMQEALRQTYIAGGMSVAATLPTAIQGRFGFNGRHWRAEQWVQRVGAELIQGIQEDTLAMAREAITAGLAEGRSAQTVARDLTGRLVGRQRVGGFLGLTAQQTDSIIAGRAKLLSGDPALMREYLSLKQRNRSFDGMIKAAIDRGGSLSARDVDRIIEAHKAKALGIRGRTIAQNETFTAQAAGREEGMRQVLERPDVETVSVRWQHGLSEYPRPDHVAMSGTVINLGETFDFPDGARLKHPHDPAGGAKHSIGCRCVAVYRVKVAKG